MPSRELPAQAMVGQSIPAPPTAPRPVSAAAASADARFEIVRRLLRDRQFAAAETVARSLSADRPTDPRATFYLGLALHKAKRHGEALGLLERAARVPEHAFPEAPHAGHYLGWCRYYLGDLPGAREAFTDHANRFPMYDDTHFALGLISYEEDRLLEAEASFRRALELLNAQQGAARERAKNLARLGDVYLRQDRIQEAEIYYRRAVETYEAYGEAWSKLARVLDRLDRPADAVAARQQQVAIKLRSEAEVNP